MAVEFHSGQYDTVIARCRCNFCGKRNEIIIPFAKYNEWKRENKPIQRVFRDKTASERELLISGTCSECWDKYMGE